LLSLGPRGVEVAWGLYVRFLRRGKVSGRLLSSGGLGLGGCAFWVGTNLPTLESTSA